MGSRSQGGSVSQPPPQVSSLSSRQLLFHNTTTFKVVLRGRLKAGHYYNHYPYTSVNTDYAPRPLTNFLNAILTLLLIQTFSFSSNNYPSTTSFPPKLLYTHIPFQQLSLSSLLHTQLPLKQLALLHNYFPLTHPPIPHCTPPSIQHAMTFHSNFTTHPHPYMKPCPAKQS